MIKIIQISYDYQRSVSTPMQSSSLSSNNHIKLMNPFRYIITLELIDVTEINSYLNSY